MIDLRVMVVLHLQLQLHLVVEGTLVDMALSFPLVGVVRVGVLVVEVLDVVVLVVMVVLVVVVVVAVAVDGCRQRGQKLCQ